MAKSKTTKPEVVNPVIASPVLLASFDLGNATSKIKTDNLSTEFRSIAGRLSRRAAFGEINSPLAFEFNGEKLVFGDDCRDLIDGEPMAYTDMRRYTDGFYRKLFAAALWRSFKSIASSEVLTPTIVFSIPVKEYADGKADEVKANIVGEYTLEDIQTRLPMYIAVKTENVTVVPEGAGSYFWSLYSPNSAIGAKEVAVIDIGFYTTDLTIFNKGGYVTGSADSAKIGVRHVADQVARLLRQNHSFEGDLWTVDNHLALGCIEIGTKCYSFTEQRDNAYADLADDVMVFYRSAKGSRTPNAVILSGGGAESVYSCLPDELKDNGWRVATNPRTANTDGAFMFLEKREQKKAQRG